MKYCGLAGINWSNCMKQLRFDNNLLFLSQNNNFYFFLNQDPAKKTICIYGHLDVQPALLEDGWDTEPFVLTEKDGKLYGRGSSDDKGPVLCWIHAVEAFQALNLPVPVNIKFVLEGS